MSRPSRLVVDCPGQPLRRLRRSGVGLAGPSAARTAAAEPPGVGPNRKSAGGAFSGRTGWPRMASP